MTDEQIMKALNCCQTGCVGCPLIGNVRCRQLLCQQALALIQRQQERFDRVVEKLDEMKGVSTCPPNPYHCRDFRDCEECKMTYATDLLKGGAE